MGPDELPRPPLGAPQTSKGNVQLIATHPGMVAGAMPYRAPS